jgi:hypothetical protein
LQTGGIGIGNGNEVGTVSMSGAEQPTGSIRQPRRPSLVEQARERGTRAFESDETYALDGVWESDAEVEDFVAFAHAACPSGSA